MVRIELERLVELLYGPVIIGRAAKNKCEAHIRSDVDIISLLCQRRRVPLLRFFVMAAVEIRIAKMNDNFAIVGFDLVCGLQVCDGVIKAFDLIVNLSSFDLRIKIVRSGFSLINCRLNLRPHRPRCTARHGRSGRNRRMVGRHVRVELGGRCRSGSALINGIGEHKANYEACQQANYAE